MARQPTRKYQPTRYGNQFHDEIEQNANDPAADALHERVGGSYFDVQLTDAQIRALAAAPITILAAPGANRAIVVDAAYLFINVAVAYDDAAADGNLNLRYVAGADASAGFEMEADAFIDAAASTGRFFAHAHDYVAGAALVVTPTVNVGIELDNDGAEFTGGAAGNTLSVRIYYHLVDFVAFT